jgi:hypothetical protein
MNKDETELQNILNECSKHRERMAYAYKKILPFLHRGIKTNHCALYDTHCG